MRQHVNEVEKVNFVFDSNQLSNLFEFYGKYENIYSEIDYILIEIIFY